MNLQDLLFLQEISHRGRFIVRNLVTCKVCGETSDKSKIKPPEYGNYNQVFYFKCIHFYFHVYLNLRKISLEDENFEQNLQDAFCHHTVIDFQNFAQNNGENILETFIICIIPAEEMTRDNSAKYSRGILYRFTCDIDYDVKEAEDQYFNYTGIKKCRLCKKQYAGAPTREIIYDHVSKCILRLE